MLDSGVLGGNGSPPFRNQTEKLLTPHESGIFAVTAFEQQLYGDSRADIREIEIIFNTHTDQRGKTFESISQKLVPVAGYRTDDGDALQYFQPAAADGGNRYWIFGIHCNG
ncbi:MAG: hypothetical protein R6V54_02470 [Desulfobacteraceae bacterium]